MKHETNIGCLLPTFRVSIKQNYNARVTANTILLPEEKTQMVKFNLRRLLSTLNNWFNISQNFSDWKRQTTIQRILLNGRLFLQTYQGAPQPSFNISQTGVGWSLQLCGHYPSNVMYFLTYGNNWNRSRFHTTFQSPFRCIFNREILLSPFHKRL